VGSSSLWISFALKRCGKEQLSISTGNEWRHFTPSYTRLYGHTCLVVICNNEWHLLSETRAFLVSFWCIHILSTFSLFQADKRMTLDFHRAVSLCWPNPVIVRSVKVTRWRGAVM
jgi:hypothetical protein